MYIYIVNKFFKNKQKIYNLNDMVLEENKDQIKQIYENFPKVEKII